MSEMVERVARAIQATRGPHENWDRATEATRNLWMADARAAIEAMREPTAEMLAAGMAEAEVDLASEYRAMIGEALRTTAAPLSTAAIR